MIDYCFQLLHPPLRFQVDRPSFVVKEYSPEGVTCPLQDAKYYFSWHLTEMKPILDVVSIDNVVIQIVVLVLWREGGPTFEDFYQLNISNTSPSRRVMLQKRTSDQPFPSQDTGQ